MLSLLIEAFLFLKLLLKVLNLYHKLLLIILEVENYLLVLFTRDCCGILARNSSRARSCRIVWNSFRDHELFFPSISLFDLLLSVQEFLFHFKICYLSIFIFETHLTHLNILSRNCLGLLFDSLWHLIEIILNFLLNFTHCFLHLICRFHPVVKNLSDNVLLQFFFANNLFLFCLSSNFSILSIWNIFRICLL